MMASAPPAGRRWQRQDLAWLLALWLGLGTPAGAAEAPQPGQPIPAVSLPGVTEPGVDLANLRGKLVYLYFWASWCPTCQQAFPWLNHLQQTLGPQGLQVVGVNVDMRRADADAFLVEHPAAFQIGFDPAARLPRSFDVQAMPAAFLVGRDGRLLFSAGGGRPAEQPVLEKRIRDAIARH